MARTLRPRSYRGHRLSRRSSVVVTILLCIAAKAVSAEDNSLLYRSGVRNGFGPHRLSAERLSVVATSLRAKTGFLELNFDGDGFLTLGDRTRVAGGSAAARDLLIAAVDGTKSFVLEDHSPSRRVSFARLAASVIYRSWATGQQVEMQSVLLDFRDFGALRGEQDVLAAFDVGFAVLHELAHGALGLGDTARRGEEPGDCENYINHVRRDLGLPERLRYEARARAATGSFGLRGYWLELPFARTVNDGGRSKIQHRYLTWNTAAVGEAVVGRPAAPAAQRERAKTLAGVQ
jgi:hypothetical protein